MGCLDGGAGWKQVDTYMNKVGTDLKNKCDIAHRVSGKKYAFRIRALGPNDLESPRSDAAVCLAP